MGVGAQNPLDWSDRIWLDDIMKLLQEGDVIELDGQRVYMYGKETTATKGRYLVVKTTKDGGGHGHGQHDVFPDGHHVHCVKILFDELTKVEVDFYQSGCFTAMISNITPVAKAEKSVKWKF